MAVTPELFREAMSRWATGLTVVTARDGDEIHGMLVSSFTGVAKEPPLVLVCADRSTRTHELIARAGVFAVSILPASQWETSEVFAGRRPDQDDDRFAVVAHHAEVTGAPILDDSLAWFDCRVVAVHDGGHSHTIYVGTVEAAGLPVAGDPPLIYYHRSYRSLTDHRP